ncbi:phosphatase PAP2 family protein [Legionella dresdenensis]|uniref:Phosphatase PAP2 family protein n=1 Tax=Legionella dresdenensis TaxID=450200 RepID=A0ABV8CG16_9GAMM
MSSDHTKTVLYLFAVVLLISIACLAVNHYVYQFPGNNYLPEAGLSAGIVLLLCVLGAKVLFTSNNHYLIQLTTILCIYYSTLISIILLTNAVQYTPFAPIDPFLIAIGSKIGIDMTAIVYWTTNHDLLKRVLSAAYDSLPLQLTLVPVALALIQRPERVQEFCCLVLISAIIGFSFYYFFPTTAPASNMASSLFSIEQYATGIKFHEIHNYIQPSTLAGGLIALPSFHIIWAWFCTYLVRDYAILFAILLTTNSVLAFSCVLLGWHYPVDIFGSILIIIFTHRIYQRYFNATAITNVI